METISGARVIMQPGWTLAHWSGANFAAMTSIEIHNFQQLGHKLRVGASFYLYTGAVPGARPQQLALMGLGGGNRYTIDHVIGNQLEVFYKGNNAANPAEVTVRLGCGGTIAFNGARQATGFNVTANVPRLTI
ncbi:MAG: hypothetical protein V4724_39315 [Pseudomonadota bacterium]